MSSNMERVAAMPGASLYVNRDGRRADDCVDSHGGGEIDQDSKKGYYSLQKAVSLNLFRVLNSTMAKGLPFPPPAPPSPCRAPVYYAPKCYVVSSPPPSRCCRPHSTSPQYRGPFTALL